MTQGLQRLKGIMPENQTALTKAAKSASVPNVSTQKLEETPIFDSHVYETAFLAQATMGAEHIDLAAASVRGGVQELVQMRSDLEPIASQLKGMRLPDTRVNIDGIKMECPHELKQFAIDLDQEQYQKIMFALLGKERMQTFRRHSTKANQSHTPALWLNQAVWFETKKPYVFLIARNLRDKIETLKIDDETAKFTVDYLKMVLGTTLYIALSQIAQVNQLHVYIVFAMIVDEVLSSRDSAAVPTTPSSLWDDPEEVKSV